MIIAACHPISSLDQYGEGTPERTDCTEKAYKTCYEEACSCLGCSGDLTCQELQQCSAACPEVPEEQPNPCVSDCWSQGTVAAQMAYQAILDCLDENGYWDCPETDETCLADAEAACQTKLDACFPPGPLTCKEIFDCMDTCAPTDQACFSQCCQNGTKEVQDQFGAVVDCVIAECGEEPTSECEDVALAGTCAEKCKECLGG